MLKTQKNSESALAHPKQASPGPLESGRWRLHPLHPLVYIEVHVLILHVLPKLG